MLQRLWHHAVVSRDHQQREIDPTSPSDHGVHQPLVAGAVDIPQHGAVIEPRVRVTEFDGDAARLFFRLAIGIDASQRAYQRGLAVIDVPGGADDHGWRSPHWAAEAGLSGFSRARRTSHKVFLT